MKVPRSLAVLLPCLGLASASARAADAPAGGFDGALYAGAAILGDLRLQTGSTLPDVIVVRPATGWSTAASVGYRISAPFRFTVDLERFSHNFSGSFIRAIQPRIACLVNGVTGACPDPGVHGRVTGTTVLAGLQYEVALSPLWFATAGVGVGALAVRMSATSEPAVVLPTPVKLVDTQDTAFAASGSLDIHYRLTPRLTLAGGYRYLRAGKPSFDAATGRGPYTSDGALSSQVFRLGVRQTF